VIGKKKNGNNKAQTVFRISNEIPRVYRAAVGVAASRGCRYNRIQFRAALRNVLTTASPTPSALAARGAACGDGPLEPRLEEWKPRRGQIQIGLQITIDVFRHVDKRILKPAHDCRLEVMNTPLQNPYQTITAARTRATLSGLFGQEDRQQRLVADPRANRWNRSTSSNMVDENPDTHDRR
jgi:hypothetical protein